MTIEVIVASGNEGKVSELYRLFDEPLLRLCSMKHFVPSDFEVEETGETFEANAWLKAIETCKITGRPAIADDSGLEVDALGGRPGVYSARYAGPQADDGENNRLLLHELALTETHERTARFRCVLAFAAPPTRLPSDGEWEPERIAVQSGVIEGRIVKSPRGENGFGYDPLFEPLAWPGRTTAQISPEEKNEISHRAQAARAMAPDLRSWLRLNTGRKFP